MTLTPQELACMQDVEFLLTKKAVVNKVDALFAEIRDKLRADVIPDFGFPKEVDTQNGKIFRGENYKDLPYLVLDYPKHFGKESVFAFRTMFWWGNFFSCTLHLQDAALDRYSEALTRNWDTLNGKNVYVSCGATPWQYHYEPDNYRPLVGTPYPSATFIKLSRKIGLSDHDQVPGFAAETLQLFLRALAA